MIQARSLTKTASAVLHTSTVRLMLVQGLSWIGSIGVLGGGVALAQAPAAETMIPDPAPAQTANPVPIEAAPAAPPSVTAAPESLPTEFSPRPAGAAPAPPLSVTPPPAVAPSSQPVDSYSAPSSIVFSERSTGCQAVLRSGQAPVSGICGGMAAPTASQWNTPGTVSQHSGVSQLSGKSTVSVGALSVNPLGLGVGTTPSIRDFYRRTLRPPAGLGNDNIRLMFPLSIPATISSLFGWRIHPITGDARFHTGTDIAAPLGTPVLAAYAGQVAIADFLGGYGLTVALQHNKATQQTLYAHLSEVFVKPGGWVKQGEVIGRVGNTGNSTGPHLHFEFRQLTPDGWVALDAGAQLEYALAQLVQTLELAQASSRAVQSSAGVQGVIGLAPQSPITSSRALPKTRESTAQRTGSSL